MQLITGRGAKRNYAAALGAKETFCGGQNATEVNKKQAIQDECRM